MFCSYGGLMLGYIYRPLAQQQNNVQRSVLTLKPLMATFVAFNLFYQQVKSHYMLEMDWVIKHQYLQSFGLKLNK